ncbi:hypothetical protein, partial [Streptomyces sp. NBC_00048]|uniref:hypothetical protein n=1 Tax=Streptomyces sp. NBC_00048 TaxID=2975628 RepID=UPI003867B466
MLRSEAEEQGAEGASAELSEAGLSSARSAEVLGAAEHREARERSDRTRPKAGLAERSEATLCHSAQRCG